MKKLLIVFEIKKITEMMRCCDVFESFKSIVQIYEFEINKAVPLAKLKKILKKEHDDLKPVLVAYIGGKKPRIVYDEFCKVYSNGESWITREDFIKTI